MNADLKGCPVCGEGALVQHIHDRDSEIDGYKFVIHGLLYSVCDHCHERVTTPELSRQNKKVVIEARANALTERDREQRLTPSTILAIRKKLRLTQSQAARVFGGGANAFSKYENGDVTPSDGMEKLLRISNEVPEAANWLLRRGGIPVVQTSVSSAIDAKLALHSDLLSRINEEHFRQHFEALVSSKAAAARGFAREFHHSEFLYSAANDSFQPNRPDVMVA
ncbi:type II toxin-antitoxin system MqsA family antitoxin [Thiobacillus denitrificans]|uniref:type II toxin-antitoxin system MqsA family antitoxin n=1 Tax=Thiobacillus denitrificans TaxID=36861 RepID=UPI0009E90064|nr:type II TA system antitoxin MqsA family protein [Thiobacillus denitrificans]